MTVTALEASIWVK